MPYVSHGLVARLLHAPVGSPIVAPRQDGRWQPLFARYDAVRVVDVAVARSRSIDHSLQRLLDVVGAEELPLQPAEAAQLRDWDSPEDVGPNT